MLPIDLICPFTRQWALDRWIENLESLDYPKELINLCFIVDDDEPRIISRLKRLEGYRSLQAIMNDEHSPNEARPHTRRVRIAEVMNQFKRLLAKTDGEYVIGLEDDTVFDGLDLMRLLDPLITNPEIGFVEGVQSGRWGVKMIGAWVVGEDFAETLLPSEGYQEISAGGYYGYATRKHLFVECDHRWDGEVWGPDVNFGLYICKQGYRCLVDWETRFFHNDHNVLIDTIENLTQICYTKSNDIWRRIDIESKGTR